MERLGALDTEFLHLEDGISHMSIGGMSVLDGSPPSEDEVLALLASALPSLPRYRQRLQSVPFELGRPVWGDDPHFNTVNDVVLAAVTNGYRDLLLAHGDDTEHAQLRTIVPVSVRADHTDGTTGNHVSALLYDLPVSEADPVARLDAVHAQMTELKASQMPEAGAAAIGLADLVPPMLVGNTTRVVMRYLQEHPQRSLNTVTTNVPGPQFPLYCLGREMLEHRPYVPISHGLRVGTAILSYNGWLCFGITGDFATTPDVDIVARGITGGIDELVGASR